MICTVDYVSVLLPRPCSVIDREQRTRWEKDEINLKDVYGERKVKLPDHYDRDHTDFDFYDQEQNENEEVRRLRLLQIEHDAALEAKKKADPGLVKNNLETEVYSRKLKYAPIVVSLLAVTSHTRFLVLVQATWPSREVVLCVRATYANLA